MAPTDANRTCADCGRPLAEGEAFKLDASGYTRCRECVRLRETREERAVTPPAQPHETMMPPFTTWTSTPPSESGWFRWRADRTVAMECVLVDIATGRVWRRGDPNASNLNASANGEVSIGGEWWPNRIDEPR